MDPAQPPVFLKTRIIHFHIILFPHGTHALQIPADIFYCHLRSLIQPSILFFIISLTFLVFSSLSSSLPLKENESGKPLPSGFLMNYECRETVPGIRSWLSSLYLIFIILITGMIHGEIYMSNQLPSQESDWDFFCRYPG